MSKRGWAFDDIQQTLLKGKWSAHSGTNGLNPGNSMSVVTNPNTSKSLITYKILGRTSRVFGKAGTAGTKLFVDLVHHSKRVDYMKFFGTKVAETIIKNGISIDE